MANTTTKVPMFTVPVGDDKIKRKPTNVAQTWYPGAMVALNSSGVAVKCDNTSGITFNGIMANGDKIDILGTTDAEASDPAKQILVERPFRFAMAIAAAVAGDEGKKVYAADDQTVSYSQSNSILVGTVDKVLSATSVLIAPVYTPLNPASLSGNVLTFTGTTGVDQLVIPDNLADALSVAQGSNIYLTFTTTDGSEVTKVLAPAATSVTSGGGAIQLTAGSGGTTSGTGGTITGTAGAGGAGAAVGTGGAISFAGGASTGSGAGGAASLVGGAGGLVSTGGACLITGGAGGATSGAGGACTITGGAGTASNSAGGATSLIGGAGIGSSAGGISKTVGGAGGATGAGGAAQITGGAGGATSGTGGAVTIAGGAGTNGNANGGAITLNGGALNGSGLQGQVTVQSSLAIPASGGTIGTTAVALLLSSTASFGVFVGSGAPTVVAAKGSLYLRSDGSSTSTRAYIATDGAGTWTAITTAA